MISSYELERWGLKQPLAQVLGNLRVLAAKERTGELWICIKHLIRRTDRLYVQAKNHAMRLALDYWPPTETQSFLGVV